MLIYALWVAFTAIVAFALGVLWKESRSVNEKPQTIVLRERQDGSLEPVMGDPSHLKPYEGPPLLPYTVHPDGKIEYSDGRIVDPSAPPMVKVAPPWVEGEDDGRS